MPAVFYPPHSQSQPNQIYFMISERLKKENYLTRIAFVGNYTPRQCGIATFTTDVYANFKKSFPEAESFVVAVNDPGRQYEYPDAVRFEFEEQNIETYLQAAGFLNAKNPEVVCLQHEYGIYGGSAGEYILQLMERLTMPIVTTLHTVLREPNDEQMRVMRKISDLSSRLVVMSQKGKEFLTNIYGVNAEQIDVIPHGIPDMGFVDPHFYKDRFSVEEKKVMLTFGLLSPNKGIENVINALPAIVAEHPDVIYLVVGATHPNLVRDQGEIYRESLRKLSQQLGVSQNVRFYNRFVDNDELIELLGAADIYITPYLNEAQITSGTLAYAFGCGKAVISTPYWHAAELLADDQGILVPFGDAEAISTAVNGLLTDENSRHALRKRAYLAGRHMIWSSVMESYGESFIKARFSRRQTNHLQYSLNQALIPFSLPKLTLSHVERMTDSTGMIQHARYDFPLFAEGYCTDDNVRAMILLQEIQRAGIHLEGIKPLEKTYAAFLTHAWNEGAHYFRNFMSYDRRWLEDHGSPDSNGRTLWSLGTVIGSSTDENLVQWALTLFEDAVEPISHFTSPRAMAFTLFGLNEYLKRFSGDLNIKNIARKLAERLLHQFKSQQGLDWVWLENSVTYDNARIPQALILIGQRLDRPDMVEMGLKSLEWLAVKQMADNGVFRPMGSNGFLTRNGYRADFDQQPLEASAMTSACVSAYHATGEEEWLGKALWSFEWFMGKNDLGVPVYDANSGGCCDALHIDRINLNQGAESTLSFLLALVALEPHRKRLTLMARNRREAEEAPGILSTANN